MSRHTGNNPGTHVVRGSFASATGDSRRRSGLAVNLIGPAEGGMSGAVPTSLEALLKRAEALPQEDCSSQAIFTDSSNVDGEGSQFAFTNGARFESQLPVNETAEQLHEEITVLQHALINRFRGSQKTVSGCQFRISAPQKFLKCEQCDARDKALSKAKDLIRRLKSQTQSIDRSQTTAAPRRPAEDDGALMRVSAERDDLGRRNSALVAEIHRLKDLLTEKPTAPPPAAPSPSSKRDCDAQLQKLLEQNMLLSNVIQDLSDQKDALEARCSAMDMQLDERVRAHAELQDRYMRHEQDHTNEINSLKLHLKNEKQAHADGLRSQQERHSEQLAEQLTAVAVLDKQLLARSEQLAAASASTETARASLIEEKKANLLLSGENQELNKKVNLLREEIMNLKKQQNIAENEAAFSRECIEKLEDRVRLLDCEREQVLQAAVSGSVRLCIVAPTVNVHVADKKLNFRSKVPADELNTFLQKEILSRYTFLFRQDTEETSPVSGTPLQAFMHKALSDMQTVIEGHIYAAMGSKD